MIGLYSLTSIAVLSALTFYMIEEAHGSTFVIVGRGTMEPDECLGVKLFIDRDEVTQVVCRSGFVYTLLQYGLTGGVAGGC